MTLFRLILALAALTVIAPQPAQANILKTLFPSLFRDNYNPYKTMKAPFAEDAATAEEKVIKTREDLEALIPKPSEIIPVNLPHATLRDVRIWVTNAASDALTFEGQNPNQELEDAMQYFTPVGQEQYRLFITESGIATKINSGKYRVNSVVESPPVFVGEREDQGRYKWLFEVPMLISYLDINATDYDKNNPTNYSATMHVQVARVNQTESKKHDILIELWQGKIKKQE